MTGPRIGELFAGYGGLGMGVQAVLGGEIAWFSEFDKGPSKILEHRFPGVPNHGDITTIGWSQVEPVDVLTGGSPCQDLSHAGKRQGMTEGTRSNLWVAMREAIAQLRPGLVVWENVRGAYSAAADSEVEPCAGCVGDGPGVHLRALGRVLGDLSDLGYDASWHGLRAADVGAPHGRFRVFVVATDTQGDAGRIEHRDGSLAAVPGGLRRGAGWPAGPDEAARGWSPADVAGCGDPSLTVLPTPSARDWKDHTIRREPHRPDDMDTLARALTVTLLPTPEASRAGGTPEQHLARKLAADGHERTAVTNLDVLAAGASTEWGQYAAAIQRWEALTRPAPPPTETGPKGNPRLSAAFSEWMMGLPAGWVTDVPGITRNEALKALGNGVCPQQAAAALREMFAWEQVAS